jgi:hypothetical protein
LVSAYLAEAAIPLQPRAIEQTVQGKIAGVKVRGIVDLLDTDGRILDFTTACKRPTGISTEHCLQLTTYAMITAPAASARLDPVTKTKTVQVVQQSYQVGTEDRRFADAFSHGAGVHPGRDLPAASKQSHVFSPVLRLLARV